MMPCEIEHTPVFCPPERLPTMSSPSPHRTSLRRTLVRLLALSAASLGATASCSAPSKGALVLAISTDMQAPKDINVVSVFITTDSVVKFDYLGRVLPDGTVALPSTLAVVEPDSPNAQVRIRITGFKEQSARVLRDVLTTVPHQQTSLLRLPLNFLDDGSGQGMLPANLVPLGPGGAPEGDSQFDPDTIASSCDFGNGQTSINGVCASATVDSSKLEAYDPALVYGAGGLQPNGAPTSCFDVSTCFAGATPVVGLDPATCTFPLPSGQPGTLVADAGAGEIVVDGAAPLAGGDSGSRTGCILMTCVTLGLTCGTASDGCGGTLDCGTCATAADAGAGADGGATGGDGGLLVGNDPVPLTGPGLNLALVTQLAGACNAQGQCFVPLDNDPSGGWTVTGSTVTLPPGVCAKVQKGAQLFMTQTTCPSKQPSNPVCQPTMGGQDSGAPQMIVADASPTFDASVGIPDSGALPKDATDILPDAGNTILCQQGWILCVGTCANLMTDPANCGACGHACTGTCQKGVCSTGGGGDAAASPGVCSPTTVSAAACFTANDITCTGLGTTSCSCTTNLAAACTGTGSGPCEFTWSCTDSDAGAYSEVCSYATFGVDAGGPANGGGGMGTACATYCATASSAAAEMASGVSGCGYFAGP